MYPKSVTWLRFQTHTYNTVKLTQPISVQHFNALYSINFLKLRKVHIGGFEALGNCGVKLGFHIEFVHLLVVLY